MDGDVLPLLDNQINQIDEDRLREAVEKDLESGRGVWTLMDDNNGGITKYGVDSGRVCRCVSIYEREESWFCRYHTHHQAFQRR